MKTNLFRLLPLFLALGILAPHSHFGPSAQGIENTPDANPLNPILLADRTSIQPNVPFWVALHLPHPKGWHTYWAFPGDVGIPTSLAWKLPPGWKASPIHWPAPVRVDMLQIKAQGYRGDTYLPVEITPPANLNDPYIKLEATATWMCCGQTCHPGTGNLTLTLPVEPGTKPTFTPHHEKINAALQSEPKPCPLWKSTAILRDGFVELTLTPSGDSANPEPGEIHFFTLDGMADSDAEQSLTKNAAGQFQLNLKTWDYSPANSTTLPGVIHAAKGWTKDKASPQHILINPALSRP